MDRRTWLPSWARAAAAVTMAAAIGAGCGGSSGETSSSSTSSETGTGAGGSGSSGGHGGGGVCPPFETKSCYSGPEGTEGVGVCAAGVATCSAKGEAWGPCVGEVTPGVETCDTPVDDDCNGQVNEGGDGCACAPNDTEACYDGPDGTLGIGACVSGTRACNDQGTAWGPCEGQVLPTAETCDTPEDDDCNGLVNEGGLGCGCAPGATASCYTGPAGTQGVGACQSGLKTCNAEGTAYGPCVGDVTPQPETCDTPVDDDCNGQVNEGGAGCVCLPNSATSCYTGPAGTQGVGACQSGTLICNALGTAYGACAGDVTPGVETCNDLVDADCTGVVNDSCAAHRWSAAPGDALDDEAFSVTVDPSGDVLIGAYFMGTIDVGCGPMTSPGSGEGALLWKATPAGACIWSRVFGDNAAVRGLDTDAAGNVYITSLYTNFIDFPGVTLTSVAEYDIYVAKYSSSGVLQWAKSFGGLLNQLSVGLAVDSSGNVIFTGYFNGAFDVGGGSLTFAGGLDVFVAKLDANGNHLWSKRFGDGNAQIGYAVAVDPSDNVIITGGMVGAANFGGSTLVSAGLNDIFVAKFSAAGAHLWSKRFGDSADQVGRGITTDASGNVIVTGSLAGTVDFGNGPIANQGGSDAFLLELDSAGNAVWSKGLGGPSSQTGVSVAVDSLGNIGLTAALDGSADFGGGTLTSVGATDTVVAKYTSAGAHLWSRRFGGAANQVPRAIAADMAGRWYVTGFLTGPMDINGVVLPGGGAEDLFVLSLSP